MSIKEYFRWHKVEKKPVYSLEEVEKELFEVRKEKRLQNLLLDFYYWNYNAFRWLRPSVAVGYLKRAVQIITRGWSDRDIWSLDFTIAKFALPRLIRLKEVKHGVPSSFFPPDTYKHTQEECDEAERKWNEVMDKMIWSMDYIANSREWDYHPKKGEDYSRLHEAEDKLQEGLDLFAKHFRSLWD